MAELAESRISSKSSKKRSRNPAEWKREKRKRLRIAGKEYINTRGELIRGRKIGDDCHCRRKCYVNVSEEVRQNLFEGYYSLNSHDEQNAYLFGLIRKKDIARKRSKDSVRRTCTYTYYVRYRGKEVQVCRLAFAHIHGISSPKIRNLCLKLDMNVMFPRDGRGKHDHRPKKITDETMEQIRQHIYSIVRTDRVKDFMKEEKNNGPDVNITKMWKDYLHKFEPTFDVEVLTSKSHKSQQRVDLRNQSSNMSQGPHQSGLHSSQSPIIRTSSHFKNQYDLTHDPEINFISHDHSFKNEGPCSDEINASQDESKTEVDIPTDDDSGEDEQPRLKSKPIVKHWLYSKVFHEELKFHDFLSLRKRLWELREDKISLGNTSGYPGNKPTSKSQTVSSNFGSKTERKQKLPKKITLSKQENKGFSLEKPLFSNVSCQASDIISSTLSQHGLHTPDMYILPMQLQDIPQMQPQHIQQHTAVTTTDVPHLTHHPHHQHHTSIQLNLHSFSSAVTSQHSSCNGIQGLSSVGHQQNGAQLQCLPNNTMQPVNVAHNPCNYMNLNTSFY